MNLYRVMKVAADGRPLVGTGGMMLGVRPRDPAFPKRRFDVTAVADLDLVRPGDGGLSVFADPAAIGIRGTDLLLWSLASADLPVGFVLTEAGAPHYVVEPAREITLADYQALIASTRADWRRE